MIEKCFRPLKPSSSKTTSVLPVSNASNYKIGLTLEFAQISRFESFQLRIIDCEDMPRTSADLHLQFAEDAKPDNMNAASVDLSTTMHWI
jgi:hypothetical protein